MPLGAARYLASSDDAVRSHAVNYAKKCIDLAASFDEPPLFEIVPCPVQPEYPISSVPRDILRHNFVKSAIEIVAYAADRNVSVAIEPVNRFEPYAGFLNSIMEAMSVVGAKNLGVLAGFFHLNIEDAALTDALRLAGSRLMHIHLADSNRQAAHTRISSGDR